MKMPPASLRLGLTATAALLAAATAPAQSVVTDPVGFTTLTVAAKPASTRGFTYLSLNMFRPTAFRSVVPTGGVSAAGSNTVLTFPANSFTASQFAGASGAFFLEITNGTGAGVLVNISSNTANTITLAEDVAALLTAGTSTIKVRPHWTFATAFGATNSAGFQGGFIAPLADNVSLLNPLTGGFASYYYNSTQGKWLDSNNVDASNVVIPPDYGIQVERKATSAFSFTVVGEVKLGSTEVTVGGGNSAGNYTLAPNPYPLASRPLSSIGLYTGNNATGFQGGVILPLADNLSVLNSATGGYTTYYYNTTQGKWLDSNNVDSSNVTIPEGAAVLLFRRIWSPGFQLVCATTGDEPLTPSVPQFKIPQL